MPRYEYDLPPHKVTHKKLPLADLNVDEVAQRSLNKNRAKTLADSFSVEAAGTIVVNVREDGTYWTVDGQHRVAAALLAGVTHLPCEIHWGLDRQGEATLFMMKNRESRKPNAQEEYSIGLAAELALFVDTEKVLLDHDLTIGSTSANSIGAVQAVVRIVENEGPEVLDWTLTVLEEAFGRHDLSSKGGRCWDGMLIGGMGTFLARHGEEIGGKDALPKLAAKLSRFGNANKWIAEVMSLSTLGGAQHSGTSGRSGAAYRLFVMVWNKRERGKVIQAA